MTNEELKLKLADALDDACDIIIQVYEDENEDINKITNEYWKLICEARGIDPKDTYGYEESDDWKRG